MRGMFWNLENRGVFYVKRGGGIFLTQHVTSEKGDREETDQKWDYSISER